MLEINFPPFRAKSVHPSVNLPLTPILDVLRQLVAHYGVTVVLCTATQPDFESRQGFEGLDNIREIIPLPVQERHFATLRRVEYQLPAADETWTWEQVAARVQ